MVGRWRVYSMDVCRRRPFDRSIRRAWKMVRGLLEEYHFSVTWDGIGIYLQSVTVPLNDHVAAMARENL